MSEATAEVGARVREARKRRGLTQRELAAAAGLSLSLVTKLEQGAQPGVRLETVHKLAVPLQVTTTALMSEPDADDRRHDDSRVWDALRAALETSSSTEPDDVPTIAGMRDALTIAGRALLDSQYYELSVTLPVLVRDSDVLVNTSTGRAVRLARQVRSDVRQLAAFVMGQAWQFDVATSGIQLALNDADDPVTVMSALDWQCWILLRQGRLAESGRLAERFADEYRPELTKATSDELVSWGRLTLRISSAAVRDNRPDDAREALRLARMAAGGLHRDTVAHFRAFGPVTVAMIHAENAMIQDRPDVTLLVGAQIVGRDFPVPRNFLRHRLDVAHAHAATRQYGKAVAVLQEVRASAPEWLAQQRYAKDIFGTVIERRRTLTDEMRDLARFMHLAL